MWACPRWKNRTPVDGACQKFCGCFEPAMRRLLHRTAQNPKGDDSDSSKTRSILYESFLATNNKRPFWILTETPLRALNGESRRRKSCVEDVTLANYKTLTIPLLQAELKRRDLSKDGLKAVLQARLKDYLDSP
jgi:hypothetical protein